MDLKVDFKQGYFFEINIEDLGEFKFLFSENEESKSDKDKYFMESFWNPPNYGLVDHIVGYYCEDIQKEMEKITDKNGMDYFIDGARVACLCRIESGHDDEGVYEVILDEWFDEDEEYDIKNCHDDKCVFDCEDIDCDDCEYYY